MAKKSKVSSKIKSTKVNKEELLANKKNKVSSQTSENIDTNKEFIDNQTINQENPNVEEIIKEAFDQANSNANFDSTHDENKNETSSHESSDVIQEAKLMTKRLEDESAAIDNKEQQQLIEKLLNENSLLTQDINMLNEEISKLKMSLQNERQQLIVKLEEKTALAKQQLEEKMNKIEQEKAEEVANLKDAIYMDVVTNFLDPYLLFEKTVSTPVQNEAVRAYVEGYNMIVSMFKESLNNLNIEQILVNVGDDFNADYMEAFDVEEVPNTPPNKVTKIVSKGFIYKGKILKYTSVVVSK